MNSNILNLLSINLWNMVKRAIFHKLKYLKLLQINSWNLVKKKVRFHEFQNVEIITD